MPRRARIVIPDVPQHVTQRGNNRQDVFLVPDDRKLYLELLREQAHALSRLRRQPVREGAGGPGRSPFQAQQPAQGGLLRTPVECPQANL